MRPNFLKNTHNVIAKQQERAASELAFNVQRVHAIDNESARIAILIEEPFRSRINEENLSVAIASAYDNVRYLPNSIHRMSTTDNRLYGIYVAKNIRSMSLSHAKEKASAGEGFSQINDTVFQDENDTIWTVQKDGESAYIVAQVDDNIADLIGSLNSRSIATASHSLSMEEDFGPGSSVMFYDPKKGEIAFGIATDGSVVYNPDSNRLQSVDAAHVLMVDDANKMPIEKASTKADLLAYMQKLYGQNPAFMARIREIVSKYVHV